MFRSLSRVKVVFWMSPYLNILCTILGKPYRLIKAWRSIIVRNSLQNYHHGWLRTFVGRGEFQYLLCAMNDHGWSFSNWSAWHWHPAYCVPTYRTRLCTITERALDDQCLRSLTIQFCCKAEWEIKWIEVILGGTWEHSNEKL